MSVRTVFVAVFVCMLGMFRCETAALTASQSVQQAQQHHATVALTTQLRFAAEAKIIDKLVGFALGQAAGAIDAAAKSKQVAAKNKALASLQDEMLEEAERGRNMIRNVQRLVDALKVAVGTKAERGLHMMRDGTSARSVRDPADVEQMGRVEAYLKRLKTWAMGASSDSDKDAIHMELEALSDEKKKMLAMAVEEAKGYGTKMKEAARGLPKQAFDAVADFYKTLSTREGLYAYLKDTVWAQASTFVQTQGTVAAMRIALGHVARTILPFVDIVVGFESVSLSLKSWYFNSQCQAYINRVTHAARMAKLDIKYSSCQAMATTLASVTGANGGLWKNHRLLTMIPRRGQPAGSYSGEYRPLCKARDKSPSQGCEPEFIEMWRQIDSQYSRFLGDVWQSYFSDSPNAFCREFMIDAADYDVQESARQRACMQDRATLKDVTLEGKGGGNNAVDKAFTNADRATFLKEFENPAMCTSGCHLTSLSGDSTLDATDVLKHQDGGTWSSTKSAAAVRSHQVYGSGPSGAYRGVRLAGTGASAFLDARYQCAKFEGDVLDSKPYTSLALLFAGSDTMTADNIRITPDSFIAGRSYSAVPTNTKIGSTLPKMDNASCFGLAEDGFKKVIPNKGQMDGTASCFATTSNQLTFFKHWQGLKQKDRITPEWCTADEAQRHKGTNDRRLCVSPMGIDSGNVHYTRTERSYLVYSKSFGAPIDGISLCTDQEGKMKDLERQQYDLGHRCSPECVGSGGACIGKGGRCTPVVDYRNPDWYFAMPLISQKAGEKRVCPNQAQLSLWKHQGDRELCFRKKWRSIPLDCWGDFCE